MAIETFLDQVFTKIKTNFQFFQLLSSNDGRVISNDYEDQLITFLEQECSFDGANWERAKVRDWYDVCLHYNNKQFFINIKATTFEYPDNTNCKLGLYYTFYNPSTMPKNNCTAEQLAKLYTQPVNFDSDNDYYFFILNKNNPSKTFWTSIKRLVFANTFYVNGNNLPFQIHWGRYFNDCLQDDQFILPTQDAKASYDLCFDAFNNGLRKQLKTLKIIYKAII